MLFLKRYFQKIIKMAVLLFLNSRSCCSFSCIFTWKGERCIGFQNNCYRSARATSVVISNWHKLIQMCVWSCFSSNAYFLFFGEMENSTWTIGNCLNQRFDTGPINWNYLQKRGKNAKTQKKGKTRKKTKKQKTRKSVKVRLRGLKVEFNLILQFSGLGSLNKLAHNFTKKKSKRSMTK